MTDEELPTWSVGEDTRRAWVYGTAGSWTRFRPMTLTDFRILLAAMPEEQWEAAGIVKARTIDALATYAHGVEADRDEWKRRAEAAEKVVDAARRMRVRGGYNRTLERALNHYDLACSNAECESYEVDTASKEDGNIAKHPDAAAIVEAEPDVVTAVKREVARVLREVASDGARSYPSPTWEVAFVHVASRLEQVE